MSLEWMRHSACKDEPTELFFPLGIGPAFTEQINEAKAVCSGCPVRAECLTHAFVKPEKYGIWGGMAEDDRQPARRKAMRQALKEAS
jgi:WhiB family redox-sensing transcriptional regulator